MAKIVGQQIGSADRSAYFFAPFSDSADRTPYPHQAIALAEGLESFKVRLFADRDYWQRSERQDDVLFRYDPAVGPENCDLVFVDRDVLGWRKDLNSREIRRRCPHAILILTDHYDITWQSLKAAAGSLYDVFDLVLKAYTYEGSPASAKTVAWPFGIARRQIDAAAGSDLVDFTSREHAMRVNFRHTPNHPHTVRLYAGEHLYSEINGVLPMKIKLSVSDQADGYESLMWHQTGRRHMLAYFKDLQRVQACATFGGWFVPRSTLLSIHTYWVGFKLLQRSGRRSRRIAQWDSWRLWETMLCGSVAINVDFKLYGMHFPVAPENWTHYAGFDLDRPAELPERLLADPEMLSRIARQGRAWALEHYSPEAVAQRLMALIGW